MHCSANTRPYRILSIDGGGIRGIYTSRLLRQMEEVLAFDCCNQMDLVMGTSTGTLIAAGLACGVPSAELEKAYREIGHAIFFFRPLRMLLALVMSRYSDRRLKEHLYDLFGDKTLGDAKMRIWLPVMDIEHGRTKFFKSDNPEHHHYLIRDLVHAACAAQTFFKPVEIEGHLYVDAGLWAYNPGLVAATYLRNHACISFEQMHILSLGSGRSTRYYAPEDFGLLDYVAGWGLATRWREQRFINMVLNMQGEIAQNMLETLIPQNQRVRISFEAHRDLWLDDPDECDFLIEQADRDFKRHRRALEKFFA